MQGASNQHIHLPNEKLSQIAESLKSNSQKVQNLKKKMLQFMNNYDKRVYNGVCLNEYHYKLYRSKPYYDFSMSFKDAQTKINSVPKDLSNIEIKLLKESIDQSLTELGKCVEFLKQCSQAHLNIRPQQYSESFQSTLKYLNQISTDINQIHSNLIIINEKAVITFQEKTDLPKGARISSPLKIIKVKSASKIISESTIVNDPKKSSNNQSPSSEKSAHEKDNRSLEQMIREALERLLSSDTELSNLIPKKQYLPDESQIVQLNCRKMITIQQDINKVAQIVFNALDKVKKQNITIKKGIKENPNSESQQEIKNHYEQKILPQLKADYNRQLSELNQKIKTLQSQIQKSQQTLQNHGKQINEKNQLIKNLETQLTNSKNENKTMLAEKNQLDTKISQMDGRITQLESQEKRLKLKIEQMESKLSQPNLTSGQDELKAQITKLISQNSQTHKKDCSNQQKFEVTTQHKQKIENQQKLTSQQNSDYDRSLSVQNQKIKILESQAEISLQNIQIQGKQINEKDQLIQNLKSEIKNFKAQKAQFQAEKNGFEAKIKQMTLQIQQLKRQKQNLKPKNQQTQSNQSEPQMNFNQTSELKGRISKLTNQNYELRSKNQSLNLNFQEKLLTHSTQKQQKTSLESQIKNKKVLHSVIYEHDLEKNSNQVKSSILESDENQRTNLNAAELTEEEKLTAAKVQSLKKELTTLDFKLTQKQSELSSIENKLIQQRTQLTEEQTNQKALYRSLNTALLELMQSINLKSLAQEATRSCEEVCDLAKSKFRKSGEQVQETEAELEKVKSQTSTLQTNYRSLVQKLKLHLYNSQIDVSLRNNEDLKECLAAFQKYLVSEFNLIKLNLMTMAKKQHKADVEFSRLQKQNEDLFKKIQALTQEHQSKQAEVDNLKIILQNQKRNLQTVQQQYQTYIPQMFGSIAQAQRKKEQEIKASSNENWLNQQLSEKQQQTTQLNAKITLLQKQKSVLQFKNTDSDKKLQDKQNLITQLKTKITSIQQQSQKKQSKSIRFENELKLRQQEITRLNDKINLLQQKYQRKKDLINSQSIELAKTKQKQSDLLIQLKQFYDKSLKQADQVKNLLATLQVKQKKLDNQKALFKNQMQRKIKESVQSFESAQKKFEQKTKQQVRKLTANFNIINQNISNQRDNFYKKYQQANKTIAILNGSLKTIYMANYKYLTIEKKHTQGLDYELANDIQTNIHKILNEKEVLHIVAYSIYAISFAEGQFQKANQNHKESEHRLKKLKQLLENINQSKDFYQSLDKLSKTYHNQSDNIFDQIEYAISMLALKACEQINKKILKANDCSKQLTTQLRRQHEQNMKLQQNQLKQQYQQQIRIKNDQIAKLRQDNSKINIEIQKQTELLKQYTQANARLQQSEKKLQLQIKELNKQIETLNGVIARNQVSNGQNMQTFNQEKKKLQDRINELNEEVVQKQTKITAFQNKVKDLEKRFKDLENKNRTSLASQSQSNEELNAKLKTMEDHLTKKQREYDAKERECQNLTRGLQDTRKALNEERRKTSSGSSETLKLRAENDKILKEKRDLEKDLEKLKGDLNDLKKKNQDLNDQLKNIESDKQSVVDELNQNKQFLRQVELAIREKLNLNQEISPLDLSQAIRNFNPVGAVGCKLITSIIIHGYDAQRSAIINKIEAFSGRKIRRTDVLARYPEVKSMIYNVPKESAFIMLYKTLAGRVVGSFSEGLRKKTFIFAYWTEEEDRFGSKTREASQIEFFMPENSSANVSSVDLNDRKYLKYGRDELRINLMSMETISADSHVMIDKYYHDFKWTYILGDNKEDKIPLDEVELHKVDFE